MGLKHILTKNIIKQKKLKFKIRCKFHMLMKLLSKLKKDHVKSSFGYGEIGEIKIILL